MKKIKGLTLIELLITIAILGALMAILMPRFIRVQFQAQLKSCSANERGIATALEVYNANDLSKLYPTNLNKLVEQELIPDAMKCPSNAAEYGYELSSKNDDYTIFCNGIHHMQLPEVEEGFPKYRFNSGLMEQNDN